MRRVIAGRRWVLVLALAAVFGGLMAAQASASPGPAPAATRSVVGFSPYVDVTLSPPYPFQTPKAPSQRDVTLAFVVASPAAPCSPSWGGVYDLDQAAAQLGMDRRISRLQKAGGVVTVSFGGQANSELASACTDQPALVAAYRSVVDRYRLTRIDLDIEGAALADAAGMARRAHALAALQAQARTAGRRLAVWATVPVAPTGLTPEGVAAVDALLRGGVDLTGVNGMAMDFGSSKDPAQPMGQAVIAAGTSLHQQVAAAFARAGRPLRSAAAWRRTGLTPMIGQNDTAGEVFTLADAASVNAFARTRGLGLLSMWSANRDATCTPPLPAVNPVASPTCSGVDQTGRSFATVLGAGRTS